MSALTAAAVLEQLRDPKAPVLKLLAECRQQDNLHVWTEDRALVRRFAELLIAQKHPTLALEVASRGLDAKAYAGDHELLYWRALALVNSGNTTRGDDFVQELLAAPGLSPHWQTEGLSLAGRVRKDRATRTADPTRRRDLFREAYGYYSQAYALRGHYFPGINAATLALLGGAPGQSTDLAARVGNDVRAQLRQPGNEGDYWLWATLGEACLLLGDPAARGHYEKAVALARQRQAHGHIASIGRQVRLLAPVLPAAADLLSLFRVNPVVVFAGHNLDQPGDPVRFPADPALEEAVRLAIKAQLDALAPGVGYCTPGCGSDILFAELMRDRDAELHLVLPFAEDDFCVERLTYNVPELAGWQQRYEKLRGPLRLPLHFATTEEFLNDQVLYDFCGTFMQGLALTRAAQDDAEAIALVVHDPTAPPGPGGVLTFVENWRRTRRRLRLINLAEVRQRVTLTAPPLTGGTPRPRRTPQREVGVMLFADVAGFSGLPEPYLPAFFEAFLGEVVKELRVSPPLFQNTWGDGLYLVFRDVVSCADFALRLLRRLEHFDFANFRFPLKEDKKPGVRIGLHTGPVFKGRDAVIDRDNYFGSHVSRAARIEPVTAPGCAFCSEQFAAALAMAPGHDFVCEYLGMQPLAKEYDTCPLYRLTHREPGSPASQTGP